MAVKMQGESEGLLNTVFVEVQGADVDGVESFALGKKWFGTSAMWTTERPMTTNASGIPNCVVLDSNGEVVLMGHPTTLHSQIEELIQKERLASKKPGPEVPKELRDAWKERASGNFAAAVLAAEKVRDNERSEDAVVEAATALIADANADADRQLRRLSNMIEEGGFLAARDLAEKLTAQLGDLQQAATAKTLFDRLEGDEFEAEIKAEKALAKLEARLFTKGGDRGVQLQLQKLAEQNEGTKAAARATRLAGLITAE